MATIYERIESLCEQHGISGGKMCNDLGMSRSTMTELRKGRVTTLKLEKAGKIADYFGVSVDYLLTGEQKEKTTVEHDDGLDDLLERLRTRPEMRMLFSLADGATKEDVEKTVAIIEAMRKVDGK